jgi:protein required for attachment to host cells
MQIAHDTIVMVADGEKLLLFRNEGDEKFAVLKTVAHEEVPHAATHEQGSDRPGHSVANAGQRRSSYEDTDWHDQDEQRFARHAAETLERAAGQSQADIVLIAAPRALGEMRKHIPARLSERIVAEIPKDMVRRETDDIVEVIFAHRP